MSRTADEEKQQANRRPLGIRWTIGNVSEAGFAALRLSVWAAFRLFGDCADYVICVNSVPLSSAQARTGPLPSFIEWLDASRLVPGWLDPYLDSRMAEGVAWKLAPVRLFPERYEISFDNDVILWTIPREMQAWFESDDANACLMAEDVQFGFGQFTSLCAGSPLNSGIRGVPPGFDLETKLHRMLDESRLVLRSELDEQGLQAAVLSRETLFVVSTDDISICSPFPMHQNDLGQCGVHFVGLNVKSSPWRLEEGMAHEVTEKRWAAFQDELLRRVNSIVPFNLVQRIGAAAAKSA